MKMRSTITPHIDGVGRVMITDGGPHPADFWAQVTAEHIAPIGEGVVGKRLKAARNLQADIAEALEGHHAKVQEDERAKLAAKGNDHLKTELEADHYLDAILADIQKVAKGTEWEVHFTFGFPKPDWFDEYIAEVDRLGFDNVPALTPDQVKEHEGYLREVAIRREVGRHFRSSQNIERSWHMDRQAVKV